MANEEVVALSRLEGILVDRIPAARGCGQIRLSDSVAANGPLTVVDDGEEHPAD